MILHVPAWLLWTLAFVVGLPLVAFAIIGIAFTWHFRDWKSWR